MEYESAFLIRETDQIIGKLQILLKKKCILTVTYGNNDDKDFVTTILHIDLADELLVFYHSPKYDDIRELLNSDKVTFKADYLGIKIAFDVFRVDKYNHNGLSTFSVPFPRRLLWIEARDFYRIKILDSLSGYCHLTLENSPEPLKLKLFDISIAGFSILIDDAEISQLMMPDICFTNCKIKLDKTGEGSVSFQVRSKYVLDIDDQTRIEKIGCKFTKITPAFEDLIHRYMGKMSKIEQENRQN